MGDVSAPAAGRVWSTRFDAVLRTAPTLAVPAVRPWDERPRLFLQAGEPWLLLPAEHDPLRTLKGQIAIPAQALERLERIAASGAEFDRIAIAHEVPGASLPTHVRGAIPAAGIACSHDVAAALVGTIAPPPPATARLARALDKAVGALTAGAAAAAAAAGAMGGSALDPIVFGVLGVEGLPKQGEPAAYFPLAAWRW